MNIKEMTKKELMEVPLRTRGKTVYCRSIIILPGYSTDLHDSGYRLMDFVACEKEEPICRLSGCTDSLHLISPINDLPSYCNRWNIDCLPKSGLLRLFIAGMYIKCGQALSDFDLVPVEWRK